MDKTYTIILILVGLLVVGGIGYAIWNNSNTPQVVDQTQNQTPTQNTTPVAVLEPGSPVVLTDSVTAPYISTVVVKGTVNPNGALSTYWFEYGETTALGAKTSVYLIGSGYAKLYAPAYITGLKSNTNYYFRLSANNSIGTTNGATESFKTTTKPAPSEVVPTTTTTSATGITKNSANLQGQINPKNSETIYWFEYGLTSNLGEVTDSKSAGSGSASLNVSVGVSKLQPLTKYFFRLNAQNQFGTVNGQILNFTTKKQ